VKTSLFGLFGLALLGCSGVEASKLPTGGYRILCEKGMSDCVARADKICGGKGYTVLAGQNATKRIGGSSSSYQGVIFVGELDVACGAVQVTDAKCTAPKESDVHVLGTAQPEPTQPATPAPVRMCVPGAAQGCVGPGGCQGGQSCLADGSGYAACDCGPATRAATPALPASPGPAPSAAPSVPGAAPRPDAL
jgi:hypothetical protein